MMMMRRQFMWAAGLVLASPLAFADKPPALVATASDTLPKVDLARFFAGYQACFVLLDVKTNKYIRYNEKECQQAYSPCSSFKVPNSLIGLDSGAIADKDFLIKWDGKNRDREVLNHDHTLQTAMRDSVLWYYQELATRVGLPKMREYIDKLAYGNRDISGGLTKFWVTSSLKINAEQQVQFMRKFINNELPVKQRSMDIVKEIMVLSKDQNVVFRGKTGSSGSHHEAGKLVNDGWFVGYVEKDGRPYAFATHIRSFAESDVYGGPVARKITESVLQAMGLLNAPL